MAQARGVMQAEMKTGVTEQEKGMEDRYCEYAARAATYRHEYHGCIYLKYGVEEFYCRKIVAAFPRTHFDFRLHKETYICDAVADREVVAVAEAAMHELSTVELYGFSLLAPAAAPLLAAPGNEFREFPDHRSIQRIPLPQIWFSTDKLFFAVNVDVPAAPLAPTPPIAPTPPAERAVAE